MIKYESCFYVLSHNTILIFDNNGKYINKLSRIGNGPEDYPAFLLTKIYPNKTHELLLKSQDKQIRFCYAGSDVSIENDIVRTNSGMLFLTSITCCESDDSFLFLISPETIEMDNISEDSNPWILEVVP